MIKGDKMKLIFIDCEFTNLVPNNKLISIALVSETGEFFYSELTDTYERCECSDFVMNFVLPFLKGDPYKMSEYYCALKIADWIENIGEPCMLACDNVSWDFPHLKRLIELTEVWPANLKRDEYFRFRIMDDVAERIVLENNFDIHNALDDAKAMMLAYKIGEAWEY